MACTVDMSPYLVGQACEECGHNGLAHRGVHNPAATQCVVCELVDTVAEYKTLITVLNKILKGVTEDEETDSDKQTGD